jgi:hypothetical protein
MRTCAAQRAPRAGSHRGTSVAQFAFTGPKTPIQRVFKERKAAKSSARKAHFYGSGSRSKLNLIAFDLFATTGGNLWSCASPLVLLALKYGRCLGYGTRRSARKTRL